MDLYEEYKLDSVLYREIGLPETLSELSIFITNVDGF